MTMFERKMEQLLAVLIFISISYFVIFYMIEDPSENDMSSTVATVEKHEEILAIATESEQEATQEVVLESAQEAIQEIALEPSQEVTQEIVPELAQEVVSEPTQEPIQENVLEPIPEEESILESTISETISEDIPQNDYSAINEELSHLTCDGGIHPSYYDLPNFDLYNYISIQEDVSSPQLFDCLKQPFIDGIASCIYMEFDTSLYGTDALSHALKSSINGNYGRVIVGNYSQNKQVILEIFEQIEQNKDFANANSIMLDYLYNYTRKNMKNPSERWIIACY